MPRQPPNRDRSPRRYPNQMRLNYGSSNGNTHMNEHTSPYDNRFISNQGQLDVDLQQQRNDDTSPYDSPVSGNSGSSSYAIVTDVRNSNYGQNWNDNPSQNYIGDFGNSGSSSYAMVTDGEASVSSNNSSQPYAEGRVPPRRSQGQNRVICKGCTNMSRAKPVIVAILIFMILVAAATIPVVINVFGTYSETDSPPPLVYIGNLRETIEFNFTIEDTAITEDSYVNMTGPDGVTYEIDVLKGDLSKSSVSPYQWLLCLLAGPVDSEYSVLLTGPTLDCLLAGMYELIIHGDGTNIHRKTFRIEIKNDNHIRGKMLSADANKRTFNCFGNTDCVPKQIAVMKGDGVTPLGDMQANCTMTYTKTSGYTYNCTGTTSHTDLVCAFDADSSSPQRAKVSDIDECASNPCSNGASCEEGEIGTYTCQCLNGFTGSRCEMEIVTDINECANNPCQNGGYCTDGVETFTCTCVQGFGDDRCQTDIDECASNPCSNGASCEEGEIGTYTCQCLNGFTGSRCETEIDECDSSPCINGDCEDKLGGYRCECMAGYQGEHCETDIDECESNQCLYGQCVDGINKYSCSCESGYEGTTCNVGLVDSECAADDISCVVNADCVEGRCVCHPPYINSTDGGHCVYGCSEDCGDDVAGHTYSISGDVCGPLYKQCEDTTSHPKQNCSPDLVWDSTSCTCIKRNQAWWCEPDVTDDHLKAVCNARCGD